MAVLASSASRHPGIIGIPAVLAVLAVLAIRQSWQSWQSWQSGNPAIRQSGNPAILAVLVVLAVPYIYIREKQQPFLPKWGGKKILSVFFGKLAFKTKSRHKFGFFKLIFLIFKI